MQIEGILKTIVFRNAQNGYTVLKIALDNSKNLATLTGIFPELTGGEKISAQGEWVNHPRFGKQFAVTSHEIKIPDSNNALIHYLTSKKFPGIGPKTATALVEKFGNDLANVIENNPEQLRGVARGFSEKNIIKFISAWFLAKEEREIFLALYEFDIKGKTAEDIIKKYGKAIPLILKENPYFFSHSQFQISFFQIDPIALKKGFNHYAKERVSAAIIASLYLSTQNGHVYVPEQELFEKTFSTLNFLTTDEDAYCAILDSYKQLCKSQEIILENGNCFLPKLYHAEKYIAQFIKERICRPENTLHKDVLKELDNFESRQGFAFDKKQREGILSALQNKFSILTGGPGTGKTTILRGLLYLAEQSQEHVILAAPTGRAAKRMKEVCQKEAYTIHRLLSLDPVSGTFVKNKDNPILASFLIVDEFSMVDTELCASLFEAIPWNCRVLIVGDADQLPSVGPGNILKELLACKEIPSVKLERIFRQVGENDIAEKADEINHGVLKQPIDGRNFHFCPYQTEEEGLQILYNLILHEIPKKMKLDLCRDLQILVPMRKGPFGTITLNPKIRELINQTQQGIDLGGTHWRLGDRVMQLENNYDKNIFNGDIGFISAAFKESKTLHVDFDERTLPFNAEDISELTLAYASTIYKSQGSEYPAVIIILDTSHYRMLRRNLLYTAVTRAKGHVWILAAPGALDTSLRNQKDKHRYTNLSQNISEV